MIDNAGWFSNGTTLVIYGLLVIALLAILFGLFKLVRWAKKMPKGAYLLLALFPLLSIFPIPPAAIKQIETTKQEQLKEKESPDKPKDTLS